MLCDTPRTRPYARGMNDTTLGATLRRLREQANKTAATVAEEIGLSEQMVSFLERGERRWKLEKLVAYCHAIDHELVLEVLPREMVTTIRVAPETAAVAAEVARWDEGTREDLSRLAGMWADVPDVARANIIDQARRWVAEAAKQARRGQR